MAQAKTLTPVELQQTLDYISTHSYAMRNRVMLLTGMWSGMRVGEIASLSVGDVMNLGGSIKAEVRLTAEQTKGRHPRTVFLPQKLRDELQAYMALRNPTDLKHPLFVSSGGRAFTANVLTQDFFCGSLNGLELQGPQVTPCAARSLPTWHRKALAFACWQALQVIAALRSRKSTLT